MPAGPAIRLSLGVADPTGTAFFSALSPASARDPLRAPREILSRSLRETGLHAIAIVPAPA